MTDHENAVHIAALFEKIDAQNQTLARIETQTTLTNGRVTSLETWKNKALGAWFVVSLFGPIITGLVIGLVLGR
jgi:hypothetical protein